MEEEQTHSHLESVNTDEADNLTEKRAKRLLFLSFKFSQGSKSLQLRLLEYLRAVHPDWRIDLELAQDILSTTVPAIQRYIDPTVSSTARIRHVQKDTLDDVGNEGQTRGAINMMRGVFNDNHGDANDGAEHVIPNIINGIMERDSYYLQVGRPGRSDEAPTASGHDDQYLSQLCYYALGGHSTGDQDYDGMFQRIRAYIGEARPEEFEQAVRLRYSQLRWLVRTYNEHHPDATARLPRIARNPAAPLRSVSTTHEP